MTRYDFDEIIPRENTHAVKYDLRKAVFGAGDVTPLWVADMDFKTPDFIVEAIKERVAHEIYGYTVVPASFYEAVQSWMDRRHGWAIDREWVVCCPGVVPSLVLAVLAFSRPGDAVIVQPPVYYPFFSVIEQNERTVLNNPLILRGGRLSMDYDHLAACLDRNAAMMFLCSPHNPGGTVWDRRELERLTALCADKGVPIVSDEIHGDLVFPGHKHIPAASVSGQAAQNTVTLLSPTKTFNTAGLTLSAAIIPNRDLRRRFRQVMENMHLTVVNVLSLVACEAAYRHGENWLTQLLAYLENNLHFTEAFFRQRIPQIKVIRPEGTYLVWLDCRGLGLDPDRLNAWMVEHAKVGLNDGRRFGTGGEHYLRLNIACPLSILKEALERMAAAVETGIRVEKG